ncbi:MAG: hypothetical protein AAGA45_01025 [Verrucomicrobiota bacterium]
MFNRLQSTAVRATTRLLLTGLAAWLPLQASGSTDLAPLWRNTTNAEGQRRVQAFGPIFESNQQGPVRWEAWRPLAVKFTNEETGAVDSYFAPPLYSWSMEDNEVRWRLLFIISGTEEYGVDGEIDETTFSVWPFVFRDRDADNPEESAFAVFPFYGTINNSLLFGSFSFAAFPLYVNFHRPEAERYGAPWPFIQWQEGPEAEGFGLWPLGGHFTSKDDYDHQYALWPFIWRNIDGLDQPQPSIHQGFIPFYTIERSATVEDISIFLPMFGWRDEYDTGYSETRYLWPLWVQGSGPEREIDRWLPIYSVETEPDLQERWIAWPFYHEAEGHDETHHFERTQFLYILYWDKIVTPLNAPEGTQPAHMTHFWPFYSEFHDGQGRTQAQLFSPLAVFFPNNEPVKKLYSPLFSLFRLERDANTGVTEQGVLWDLVHETTTEDSTHLTVGPFLEHDVGPGRAKFELLSGLLGVEKKEGEYAFRFLWFTID